MLEVVINMIIFAIMPISGFYVVKNISSSSESIFKPKNFICMLVLIFLNYIIYDAKYESLITLLNFISIVVCYKLIFKRKLLDTFILSILLMVLMFISEIILSIILLPIFSAESLRTIGIPMIIANLSIGIMTVLLSKLKILKKLILNLISKLETHIKIQTIILSVGWIIITSMGSYLTANITTNNWGFWIGICIQVVFIIFIINHFRDKTEYINLNDRFDALYDYIETMEEYIDNERLNIHEYKNQLSVIRSISTNKKVIKYIDSLVLKNDINYEWSDELKNLPKGGFKGLLYYKLAIANSFGLNISVNISNNCKQFFKSSSLNELKMISRLLGIYLDNAIECAKDTKERIVSVEIYKSKELNIVISNSINSDTDVKMVFKKGYTTKGKGRGHGLYLAKKIVDKNPNLTASTKIINHYYVQKLIVKEKKLS